MQLVGDRNFFFSVYFFKDHLKKGYDDEIVQIVSIMNALQQLTTLLSSSLLLYPLVYTLPCRKSGDSLSVVG